MHSTVRPSVRRDRAAGGRHSLRLLSLTAALSFGLAGVFGAGALYGHLTPPSVPSVRGGTSGVTGPSNSVTTTTGNDTGPGAFGVGVVGDGGGG